MEIVSDFLEVSKLEENFILGNLSLLKSTVKFNGSNNMLFCEDGVVLENTAINFNGSNSFFYLSKSKFCLNFNIMDDSIIYIGKDNYFNGRLSAVVSEGKSLFIGNNSLFSSGIMIRTSDAHSIYDCSSKKRINRGGHILMGDHVWIGQDVFIAKNTFIGSGSIIGAKSILAGKKIESNTVYAGNPAKKVKSSVFFTGDSAHSYSPSKDSFDSSVYIYEKSNVLGFNKVLDIFKGKYKYEEIIQLFKSFDLDKNRFYIGLNF